MTTFVTVSSPSYDASSLASKLTEKTTDGWTVVAIVPAGSEITAFLSRDDAGTSDGDGAASAPLEAAAAPASDPSGSYTIPAEVAAPVTVSEPAGWGSAPDNTPAPTAAPVPTFEPAPSYQPAPVAAPAPAPAPAPTPAPVSSVPAGWYADPSGRFELRYWDGSQWSEHVSRGGQQFTDAPTA